MVIRRDDVRQWTLDLSQELRESSWGPGLSWQGIDLADALFAPLFVALLAAARSGGAHVKPVGRWRHHAYLVRQLGGRLRGMRPWRRIERPSSRGVLLWPREPTHLDVHLHIARALREGGEETTFLTNAPGIGRRLRAQGENAIVTCEQWPGSALRAQLGAMRLTRYFERDPGALADPFDVPKQALLAALRQCLRGQIPVVLECAAALRRAALRLRPYAVVIGNDVTPEGRVALTRAGELGFRTACPMHGTIQGPFHPDSRSDRVLVYGPRHRESLLADGYAPDRVVVCGAPQMDTWPAPGSGRAPELVRLLGLRDDRHYVLVATSGPGDSVSEDHHRAVIRALLLASRALPDVQLVAKLHRKDRPSYYEEIARSVADHRVRVVPHGAAGYPAGIATWLCGAAAVVTGASTVGVEAMAMEVPVVTVDLADELAATDFIRAGATRHVTRAEDLAPALDIAVRSADPRVGAAARRFAAGFFGPLDRQASARAAGAIARLRPTAAKPPSNG